MSAGSSLYVGSVMHRRLAPRRHRFRYRAFWLLLELDAIATVSAGLTCFSHNRPNLFSFYDTDHGDGSGTPLRLQIERQLAAAGIAGADGPIYLLCMPRTLGYSFNPLSIYFCHRADGILAALVYEVHNTFGERHSYVMAAGDPSRPLHHSCRKRFYVSPFMDMDLRYDFRIAGPDERIAVAIAATGASGPVLNAVLAGTRQPLTDANLMRVFLAVPVVTLKVITAIHWQALRLWIKGVGLRQRPAGTARQARRAAAIEVAE
jgi:DUF1365 family protein